jgi:hypothetical protein
MKFLNYFGDLVLAVIVLLIVIAALTKIIFYFM